MTDARAEVRREAYAEALRHADDEALTRTNFYRLTATYDESARAVLALVDAELAALAADRDAKIEVLQAEVERTKRGAKELGRILDRTLRDALDASGRHDVIAEDGDGDWQLVWETLAELRPRADAAEAETRALRERLTALANEQWLNPVNYKEPVAAVLRTIQSRLAALAASPCPTCTGPVRRTVGMVCQTCGTDYAPAVDATPEPTPAAPSRPSHDWLAAQGADGVEVAPAAEPSGDPNGDNQ